MSTAPQTILCGSPSGCPVCGSLLGQRWVLYPITTWCGKLGREVGVAVLVFLLLASRGSRGKRRRRRRNISWLNISCGNDQKIHEGTFDAIEH